jgi:hypothetical protein
VLDLAEARISADGLGICVSISAIRGVTGTTSVQWPMTARHIRPRGGAGNSSISSSSSNRRNCGTEYDGERYGNPVYILSSYNCVPDDVFNINVYVFTG